MPRLDGLPVLERLALIVDASSCHVQVELVGVTHIKSTLKRLLHKLEKASFFCRIWLFFVQEATDLLLLTYDHGRLFVYLVEVLTQLDTVETWSIVFTGFTLQSLAFFIGDLRVEEVFLQGWLLGHHRLNWHFVVPWILLRREDGEARLGPDAEERIIVADA